MIGQRPGKYWRLCWKFVSPCFLLVSHSFWTLTKRMLMPMLTCVWLICNVYIATMTTRVQVFFCPRQLPLVTHKHSSDARKRDKTFYFVLRSPASWLCPARLHSSSSNCNSNCNSDWRHVKSSILTQGLNYLIWPIAPKMIMYKGKHSLSTIDKIKNCFFMSFVFITCCPIVYGGCELCHVQPSQLRLLHVSSVG